MAHSTAERQHLLEELAEPLCTSVDLPKMRGIGLGVNGALRDAAISPRYVVGVWFTVFFFPICPVGAYLVSKRKNFFGARPVHARLKFSDIAKIWGVGRLALFILSGPFNMLLAFALVIATVLIFGSYRV